jgi:hypothetical protein
MSRVRVFQRALEGDRLRFEADGFTEVARESIPSLSEDVVLMEQRTGLKNDAGKLRWSLLWPLARQLEDVIRVLMHGAKEYGEDPDRPNFQQVADPIHRYGDALHRHIFAWASGEKSDARSGLPHLAHAVANLLFIAWHEANNTNDRR